MTIEFTDRQVELVVESLRYQEAVSRHRFAKWLAQNMGVTEGWAEKHARSIEFFAEMADIRRKFGDTGPVKINLG